MIGKGDQGLSRRGFVCRGGLLASGAVLGANAVSDAKEVAVSTGEWPRVILGRTGQEVTRMTLGTVPSGMEKGNTPRDVAKVIDAALQAGVRSVDVAPVYVNAEAGAGLALGARRPEVFLSTKVRCDTVKDAEASFANSLRLLKTDWVDVLYLHSVGSREQDRDPDVVLAADSVFPWLLKQKRLGKCRFVGVSSHNAPSMCKQVLDTGEVDVLLTVINFVDRYTYNHEGQLLPVARKHGTGVIAMKVFGGSKRLVPPGVARRFAGAPEIDLQYRELAIRYAMGVSGVTAVNIGSATPEQLRQNVAVVKAFQPLTPKEHSLLEKVGRQLAPAWHERFGPAERPKRAQEPTGA